LRKALILTFVLALLLTGCGGGRKEWSQENITSFVTYYAKDALQIDGVDVAIIDTRLIADTLEDKRKIVEELKSRGMYVITYVAIGEDVKEYNPNYEMKSYYYDTDGDGKPDLNPSWGSIYVNANHPEWQEEVMKRIQQDAIDTGADGIFMDQIDTGPKEPQEGLELIRRIRETYPKLKLIANQGLKIFDQTAPLIDGIMLESFTSTWLSNEEYAPVPYEIRKANARVAKRINEVRETYPMPVFVIDYTAPDDYDMMQQSIDAAWALDFVPYVAYRLLNQIYDYDLKPTVERGSLVGQETKEFGELPDPRRDPNNIALATNGAVVRVDSLYENYSEEPLNDGYRHESALVWYEIAWASSTEGDNHWVEIEFPGVKKPRKVDIYWALDFGEYKTSKEVAIQAKVNGDWVTLGKVVEPEGFKEMSTFEIDEPVETNAIRIFQEKDQGPVNYPSPNIMWISEIEIFE